MRNHIGSPRPVCTALINVIGRCSKTDSTDRSPLTLIHTLTTIASGYGTNLGPSRDSIPRFTLTRKLFALTEGPWTEVMQAIQACHAAVHAKGAPRIATDIRIGTRVDRIIAPGTGNESKLKRVEDILKAV